MCRNIETGKMDIIIDQSISSFITPVKNKIIIPPEEKANGNE